MYVGVQDFVPGVYQSGLRISGAQAQAFPDLLARGLGFRAV